MLQLQDEPLSGTTGGFADLGLHAPLLEALSELNFHTPTDIQRELIPPALAGRDCLGQARTGTGKTAAFGLPALQRVQPGEGLQAIVLVPTRELASQVTEHLRALGSHTQLKIVAIVGGAYIAKQAAALKRNPEIAVGTPGRILDMMKRNLLDISQIRIAVLDEVDRMLDVGFRDDIRRILKSIKTPHQTVFVSATLDAPIQSLARTFMRDPLELNVSRDEITVDKIEQAYVSVDADSKYETLLNFIRVENPPLAIVFTRTKHTARRVAERLTKAGINCKELHGDLVQRKRDKVMDSFRKAHIQVLVATDLVSRGLDVLDVSHIINYDIPEDPAVYVHRIGRTARMGRAGRAITFVLPDQGKELTEVEKLINRELPRTDAPWVVRKQQPAQPEPEPAEPTDGPLLPQRFQEAVRRDEVLEKLGIQPVRRTLGSRFRTSRRGRIEAR